MEKRHLDRRLAADGGRGHRVPRQRRTSASTSASRSCARSSTPSCSPAAPPRGATCPIPGREHGGIHQAMEYLPFGNRVQQGDIDEPPHHRRGQARRDHRRWRHRRRLPRHVAPPGRGVGPPVRDPAPPARLACAHQPVAHVVEHLPGVVGARGRWRARLQRQHRVFPRRRRRQRARAACARGRDGRRQVREDRGHRLRAAVRARAARDGLPRPAAGGPARRSSASSSTGAATSRATRRS